MFINQFFERNETDIQADNRTNSQTQRTILDVSPGYTALLAGFSPRLPPERRHLLRAYGLVPGYPIRLIRHSPVSIVQVEHSEIALEPELAGEIFVAED